MKIKVEVDLNDFYSEEDEGAFSEQIKDHIAYNVKREVFADWQNKIGDEFKIAVKAEIEKQKDKFITSVINDIVVNEKVKKRYGSEESISISDWIKDELKRIYLTEGEITRFLEEQTTKTTKQISEVLKERHDMLFASQIVSKLNQNQMLKESVAKTLLCENVANDNRKKNI